MTIGRDTNIGAGTIVCNYDGFHKYRTKIGDRVQVGSDSTLVAPISLGDDVYVATATTIRHDIPSGALAFNEREERVREARGAVGSCEGPETRWPRYEGLVGGGRGRMGRGGCIVILLTLTYF